MNFRFSISDFRFAILGTKNRQSKIANAIMLAAFLSTFTVAAQEISESIDNPFIIKSIAIQGSKTMPEETILGILQSRVGEEASSKRITDDVKELFKLGQFSNIKVDSSGTKDGIELTFILDEWPKVKDVSLHGNEEFSDSKIKDVLIIGPGRSLSGRLLHESKSKILDLYQKEGYYLAQVESDSVPDPSGSVSVSFSINEGRKVKVKEIDIIGNRRVSDREIRKQMKIKKGKKFDDALFEGDLKVIEKYYHQNGYINAKIIGRPSMEFDEDKTGLIVRIELEEGPQFRVGMVHVTIEPDEGSKPLFTEKEILEEFALKEGDVFNEAAYSEGIGKISAMYLDKGRVSVQIKPGAAYNNSEETVDLELSISEGGPAYIKDASINWISETSDEPHKTKEYVIRRELRRFDIEKGEMFSYRNIEDARRKILTLGPFIRRAVPSASTAEDSGKKVSVNFDIEESRQSGMFSIAGGYGSGESGGGVFGALDIWDDNILGRAWRLHLRGEMGQNDRRIGQIYFSTPWVFNTPTSLGFSLYSKRTSTTYYPGEEEKALYKDESVGGSITIGRPLTRKIDLSMRLRNEKASSKEWLGDETGEWKEKYSGTIRSIKLIADRDTRQFITSIFDPSSGSSNTISAEFSGLGGDRFQKYMTESSVFIPTWWRLVLVFHLRTGYFTGEYPTVKNMRYERFFLDGMDSVRGYRYITPPGDYQALGGNQMALLNVEYRFPIKDMLSGLIFFDAGQTWADNELPWDTWDRFKPKKSIGIGVRIDLLGALARFEWGYPLDEGEEERFRFDIGPAF